VESRPYTLYGPIVTAETEAGYDSDYFASSFEGEMVDRLVGAGFERHRPIPGTPDMEIVLRGWVTTVDPGSPALRDIFGFGAGAAVFEAAVQVERAGIVLGEVEARGVRRFTWWGGGDSSKLLDNAAELAGRRAAKKVAALLSRP
jgi:hypothetical protein